MIQMIMPFMDIPKRTIGFDRTKFFDVVAGAMKRKGYTVRSLSAKLELSHTTYYRHRKSDNVPLTLIIDMCALLDLDLTDFLYDEYIDVKRGV